LALAPIVLALVLLGVFPGPVAATRVVPVSSLAGGVPVVAVIK